MGASEECRHEAVWQFSTIYAKTLWMTDGVEYRPEDTPLTKVLDETTDHFECIDCGVRLADIQDDEDHTVMEDADGRGFP